MMFRRRKDALLYVSYVSISREKPGWHTDNAARHIFSRHEPPHRTIGGSTKTIWRNDVPKDAILLE